MLICCILSKYVSVVIEIKKKDVVFFKLICIVIKYLSSENTLEVDLVKGNSGLGFSVLGVQDVPVGDPSHGLPRIKKIFPLGAAMDSGKLEVGDVILEVNGQSVKDLSHAVSKNKLSYIYIYENLDLHIFFIIVLSCICI